MVAQGLATDGKDPGMKGVTRYGRLPVGWNTKAKYIERLGSPFVHQLEEWHPERRYSLQDIIEAFALELDRAHTRGTRVETDDPILKALEARGLVKGPMNNKPGVWDITCPWLDEHTDRADSGTAYFEPHFDGREKPGFKCHHGHCANRSIKDLLRLLKPENRAAKAGIYETYPYTVLDGAIHYIKRIKDGDVAIPLGNFDGRITREVVHDDGAEVQNLFLIEGVLANGRKLAAIEVMTTSFAGLSWVTSCWGNSPVVYAGSSVKDHLRCAIQRLSGSVPRHTVYGLTAGVN
jgi:hypothetical protein